MQKVFQCYRFTRVDGFVGAGSLTSAATDALSAISVWQALAEDRRFTVVGDVEPASLLAKIEYPLVQQSQALRELGELCDEHNVEPELVV